MKKSELYKIVKAELKSVLEEQLARIRRPERDPKNLNIPRDPKNPRPKIVTGYASLSLINSTDCQTYVINDAFLCNGTNNSAAESGLNPDSAIGSFDLIDGSTMNNFIAGTGCFETNNSTVTLLDYIDFIAGSSFYDQASAEEMLADYYVEGDPALSGCYGCTNPAAQPPGPSAAYPNADGDIVYNEGGDGYDENAILDDGSCEFFGCTNNNLLYDDAGLQVEDENGVALLQYSNYNEDATPGNSYEQSACLETFIPGPTGVTYSGCTVEGFAEYDEIPDMVGEEPVTEVVDDGSCEFYMIATCTDNQQGGYNEIASDQLTAAETAINAYNLAQDTNLTIDNIVLVNADILPQNSEYYDTDEDFYCGEALIFGCTDEFADNYNPNANVNQVSAIDDDDPCQYDTNVYGCMEEAACNYNINATAQATQVNPATGNDTNEGVCAYPDDSGCQSCSIEAETGEQFTDGTGQVITSPDTDDDGVCDANEIEGCTDPNAINYNPAATEDNDSCTYDRDPIERKCKDITAVVCNAPQRKGQGKVGYAPISLGCVTIDGQTVNMDFPATSQFKYPLPSNILDPAGNQVSLSQRDAKTMGIWQVTSAVNSNNAFEITDLPFGNCKGPVTILDPIGVGVDPAPLDPKIRETIKESRKLRNIIKKELKNWNT